MNKEFSQADYELLYKLVRLEKARANCDSGVASVDALSALEAVVAANVERFQY